MEFIIAVNALSPVGLTVTEGARKIFPDENVERWVQPEDLAEAAVWGKGPGNRSTDSGLTVRRFYPEEGARAALGPKYQMKNLSMARAKKIYTLN